VGCKIATPIVEISRYLYLSGKFAPKDWEFSRPGVNTIGEAGGQFTHFDGSPSAFAPGGCESRGRLVCQYNGHCHTELCNEVHFKELEQGKLSARRLLTNLWKFVYYT